MAVLAVPMDNAGMSASEEKTKPKRWQFSLRELVAITLIVALAIGYWQERVRRQNVTNRYAKLLSMPHILIWAPIDREKWRSPATIAVGGDVFLPMNMELQNPRVTVQLVRAESLEVIQEMEARIFGDAVSGKYVFTTEFKQSKNISLRVPPGTYLFQAKCFDGTKEIATGLSVLEVVK